MKPRMSATLSARSSRHAGLWCQRLDLVEFHRAGSCPRGCGQSIGATGDKVGIGVSARRQRTVGRLRQTGVMGQNNRQRRAAKKRRRARDQHAQGPSDFGSGFGPGSGWEFGAGYDPGPSAALHALGQELRNRVHGSRSAIGVQQFLRHAERHQQHAIDTEFPHLVEHLFEEGWTPLDLFEAVRRKVSGPSVSHLIDVTAAVTGQHAARLVHPRWRAQLDQLDARARWETGRSPVLQWAQRAGLDWPAAVEQLVDLLAVIFSLPVVEEVVPPPGSVANTSAAAGERGIDAKVLGRVRALLAKAEATEFTEEAEALTAKAQQLMTQHSIDRVLAETKHPARSVPVVRRLWLDNPYIVAKSLLVSAVADANHSRSVLSEHWGFATLVGHEGDLEVVELLTTSLLVQATRAMTSAGSQFSRSGVSRTRSFRQSFLVAYANRIAERLRESADATESAADADRGGTLLPMLAARSRVVEDKMSELFPQMVHKSVGVSNAAGWGAGRAAADLAQFGIRDAVGATERTG